MPDLHDEHHQFLVLDCIDDPVLAFADSIEVVGTGEFLDALGARGLLELPEAPDDPCPDGFVESFQLALGGGGEMDRVDQGRR